MPLAARAAEITVETMLEQQEAAVGEPITMQIWVNGANQAAAPDLSHLDGFSVQERGGQSTSSTSVTNLNGSWQRVTHLGYLFNYTITPQRAGSLTIPSLELTIDGRKYLTKPVSVTVSEPRETSDLKLRVFLSASHCYVGEPVTMAVTWFVGQNVNGFEFQLPILTDPRFTLAPLPQQAGSGPGGQEQIEIPIGKESITAVKGKGDLDGKQYLTVTFQYRLAPKEAGRFTLPRATVACRTSDLRQRSGRNPFGDFDRFDQFFGGGVQPASRIRVIPANQPELTVEALPSEGRPADFSGLVGRYAIEAEASPQEMNVGDPITLKVTVSGPFAQQANLPDLTRFLPPADFKIPEEIASGEMSGGNRKVFTQTIRVKDPAVRQIPAIELSYFDPQTGKYQLARTEPIPVSARATRVVTASDAEGRAAVRAPQTPKAAGAGLAGNYDGPEALVDQQPKFPALEDRLPWLLATPPLLFFLAAAARLLKKRRADGAGRRKARPALKRLEGRLDKQRGLSPAELSGGLKEYLGMKLDKKAASLTFHDVEPALAARGVNPSVIDELRRLLTRFEKWQYGGCSETCADLTPLIDQTLDVARKLERDLG